MDGIKLDFRFADEEDAEDIEKVVNISHEIESKEGDFQFRKMVPKITQAEVIPSLSFMFAYYFNCVYELLCFIRFLVMSRKRPLNGW